ncbi:hypothetical protein [Lysobacter sp. CA199]|uniref:hypothetical protein n=1 Tax=Lysobacter sp. CA199 TaxID=3455608 RepID=UPI003F8D465A
MRYVDRARVAQPASLSDPDGAGARERASAEAHYRDPRAGVYKFKAYKGEDVKKALRTLFYGKCAYCESLHESTSPADIEHYRPKAAVVGEADHRGYWWLAADWNNLLRSCISCNRVEGHRIGAIGMNAAQIAAQAARNAGKGNLFPIAAARAFQPGDDCDGEDPLLIDPTRRDPAAHLRWHVAEDLSLLGPRFDDGDADAYGERTVEIMALNRQALVEARSRHLQRLSEVLLDLEEALDEAAQADPADITGPLRRATRKLASLRAAAAPDQEYSAMAQAFVADVQRRLLARYRDLIGTIGAAM